MSQLDNFRKSLGLPNPDETAVDVVKKERDATTTVGKRTRTTRTVALREDTYLRLRAIIFWMMLELKMQRPTIDDIVNQGLQALLDKEPKLRQYLKSQIL